MRQETVTVWVAWDETTHDTEAKCAAYERSILWKRLVGLTAEQVQAALTYDTTEGKEIGDVIATLGSRIYDARRKQRPTPTTEPVNPTEAGGRQMTAAEAERVQV